jgi:hypothetical protein
MNASQEPDRATGIARAAGVALVQQRNTTGYNQRFPDYRSYLRYVQGQNYLRSRQRPRPTPTPTPPPPPPTVYTVPTGNTGVTTSSESPFDGGGNSYSFNGANSYLSVPPGDYWAFGTGDFTIEWFQKQTDTNNFPRIFSIGTYIGGGISVACSIEKRGESIEDSSFYAWTTSSANFGTNANPFKNVWVHFAIVRAGDQLSVYKNGILFAGPGSNTANITNTTRTLDFGIESPGDSQTAFGGYLTNIRIVKGLAVYTGNFTVPTSALTVTADANPYGTSGGTGAQAIPDGFTRLLFVP